MTCPHAASGCNYPEGECAALCAYRSRNTHCGFCHSDMKHGEQPCACWDQTDHCNRFALLEGAQ